MDKKYFSLQKGYSLLEVLMVMTIIGILVGFVTVNLLNAHRQSAQISMVTQLTTDLRSQQLKAMTGNTEGRTKPDSYGIYIGPTFYTLFHGATYSAFDTTNLVVQSQNNIHFTSTFPGSIIVFSQGSGDIQNFNGNTNTITFIDSTNNTTQTMTINKYGVLTQMQ